MANSYKDNGSLRKTIRIKYHLEANIPEILKKNTSLNR